MGENLRTASLRSKCTSSYKQECNALFLNAPLFASLQFAAFNEFCFRSLIVSIDR